MDLPLLSGGRRLDWEQLPAAVRQGLQARLGSPVVRAATQPGGFSPGLAARVRLAFADIEGKLPTLPWQPDELQRVLDAVAELATTLTPAPVAAPSIATRLGEAFSGWQQLAAAAELGRDDLTGLDPWARRHLDRLVALEQAWPAAAAGRTL